MIDIVSNCKFYCISDYTVKKGSLLCKGTITKSIFILAKFSFFNVY